MTILPIPRQYFLVGASSRSSTMLLGNKNVVVLRAYNAARMLERTYLDIPHDIVDDVVLVDD